MKLEEIAIRRQRYGKDEGKLMGEIVLYNQYAKITLKLSEEQAARIVELLAEEVVTHAREVSQ
jgi:hypothetical protein